MSITTGHGNRGDRELSELSVKAALLASLVTFLVMIGLPAVWALAAAH
jgi:hypothetical protein